jgi:two-component system, LuxR family, sensor kinase FixL
MNWVTILWSMLSAASLTLGAIHFVVWLLDRKALANLVFSIIAIAVAGMAPIELAMMHAVTTQQWGTWVRWIQLPIFITTVSIVLFVRLYLGTGRLWLIAVIILVRCAILVINFLVHPNFNFREITSLEKVSFLGEEVSVVGKAVVSPWQWVATMAVLLFSVFLVDAAVTLWRGGGRDSRRKAATVGGSIVAFVVISTLQSQMVIWGVARMPVLISPGFVLMLAAMAYELSREVLHSARLARELHESEQRLELAARGAGLGMWVWDITKKEVWATDKARALLGFNKDEVIEINRWISMVHPDDRLLVSRAVEQSLENGQEFSAEYRICLPTDKIHWIAVRGRSEIGTDSNSTLMRGVLRDITERKQAQIELDLLHRELAHADRVSLLGQLASALAHELNQPLGAILRNAEAAEILLQSTVPHLEELRAIVKDIHNDDRRAVQVIDRLRALLKRRKLELQSVSVSGLVQDVITLVNSDAAARHVLLDHTVAPELPSVWGDKVHLSQVLLNLVINGMDAVDGLPDDRRRVAISAAFDRNDTVAVSVADSGRGISPEFIEKVFDPFFSTKSNGMGIGLSVSKTIVEAHGGRLLAKNNPDRGATFYFSLSATRKPV